MKPQVSKTQIATYGIEDDTPTVENTETQDALANYVREAFNEAETHKRSIGIEARLIRNLYAKKGEYDPAEMVDPEIDINIAIAALKARAAEAWMTDILLNNIDKPWTMTPTPIPDLPEIMRDEIVQMLMAELSSITSMADLKERAKELKTVALDKIIETAAKAASKMEQVCDDQLQEGGLRDTLSALIEDISTYPAVFVRGPVVISSKRAEWKNNKFTAKMESTPNCRSINPFDAFPSPTSKTTQDGQFFIERARMLPGLLYNSIGVKSFDETNIRRALEDYESGYSLNLAVDSERDRLEQKEQALSSKRSTIDVLIYNGLVPGKYLIEHNVLVDDPQKHYECEIWLAGSFVIKAALNPNLLDRRPIHSTSYVKINRSIWGQSVIDLVYDAMRVCNAAARHIVRNMGYSSGPIGECASDRLADGMAPQNIEPYKMYNVTPDLSGTGAPVFRFTNINSVANELLAVYEKFSALADDLSGIPPYVLGNPEVAGAGRTLGGLSMLMGNAAKGIKRVQLNIDNEVIAPLVNAYYMYNMEVSDDTSIKADVAIIARGATGLLQRELAQSKLIEILQLLGPFVPNWDNLPSGIKVILREILKQTGLPVDDIIADPNKQRALMDQVMELQQNAAFSRGTSSPVPLPSQSLPGPQASPQMMPPSQGMMPPQGAPPPQISMAPQGMAPQGMAPQGVQ